MALVIFIPTILQSTKSNHDTGVQRDSIPDTAIPSSSISPNSAHTTQSTANSLPTDKFTFSKIIFEDEFNYDTFWQTGVTKDTSTNNNWVLFDNYGQDFWHEAKNIKEQARTVSIGNGKRALAIESEPLRRVGSSVSWCRWAIGKDRDSAHYKNARERCRVHTSYISTFKGWENGAQLGQKIGPGMKIEVRVNFSGAKRPGQLFDLWLQVEKPEHMYNAEEIARKEQGAIGVAYDGLPNNGTEIDIFEFGFGHQSWNTAWSGLNEVSRFNTAVHFDRRTGVSPKKISRILDTLNQERLFGSLSHLGVVGSSNATFDIRSGWHIFTMEWIKKSDNTTTLDFYLQPDDHERVKYQSIENFQQYDTSNDHFLVISNEVDQGFTGGQDGLWKYIEQGTNSDGHNTSSGIVKIGSHTYHQYPEDRMLIDYVRVYQQD